MRVLGVDPGSIRMGYGIISRENDSFILIDYGTLSSRPDTPLEFRLYHLFQELLSVLSRYHPSEVALEEPFVSRRNVHAAIVVGQAQAIAILAATSQGIPVYRYTPAEVKQAVTNSGRSSKEQVQEMVRLHLNLSTLPQSLDSSDALAIALCHLQRKHWNELLQQQSSP